MSAPAGPRYPHRSLSVTYLWLHLCAFMNIYYRPCSSAFIMSVPLLELYFAVQYLSTGDHRPNRIYIKDIVSVPSTRELHKLCRAWLNTIYTFVITSQGKQLVWGIHRNCISTMWICKRPAGPGISCWVFQPIYNRLNLCMSKHYVWHGLRWCFS